MNYFLKFLMLTKENDILYLHGKIFTIFIPTAEYHSLGRG